LKKSYDVIKLILLLEEVKKEFLEHTHVLIESLMENLALKKVAGKLVTGRELMGFLQAYVTNLKNGVAPEPQNMIKVRYFPVPYN
jgi:hypothetical protein